MNQEEMGNKKIEITTSGMYDYWLCSIPGVGNRSICRLLELFGSAEEIYRTDTRMFSEVLNKRQLDEMDRMRQQWDLSGAYEKLVQDRIGFVTSPEPAYPERLRQIPDPPYGIFYKGRLPEEISMSVAVIGARDCSEYGRYVAEEFGRFLGKNKIQVISGMARGIDGISQEAALQADGTTTAVLGSGVDVCYPAQNRRLYEKILEKEGGIVSLFPPGTQPRAQNFPPRNRIVSGLADVVVVIEARNKSGTLITVDMALEQGKEVYVVPGRITDRLSEGCNRLIRQGAGILLSTEEFLEELQALWQRKQGITEVCDGKKRGREGADKEKIEKEKIEKEKIEKEKIGEENSHLPILAKDLQPVYARLDFVPFSVEKIMSGLPGSYTLQEVNVKLMQLCLLGVAEQKATGYFCRK